MSVTSNGATKGEPIFASTGNSPTFAADLTAVGTYAALVGNRKAGTAATRTGLTGSAIWDGLEYQETDTGMILYRQGGQWLPARPNVAGATLVSFSATNTFTNASAYTTYPVAGDASALLVSFTKYSANSRLLVSIDGSAQLSSGVAQNGYFGIRINGSDSDVVKRRFNTATDREDFGGTRIITGAAAGTYNVLPVFHGSGASVFEFFTDDCLSWTISEVT